MLEVEPTGQSAWPWTAGVDRTGGNIIGARPCWTRSTEFCDSGWSWTASQPSVTEGQTDWWLPRLIAD